MTAATDFPRRWRDRHGTGADHGPQEPEGGRREGERVAPWQSTVSEEENWLYCVHFSLGYLVSPAKLAS